MGFGGKGKIRVLVTDDSPVMRGIYRTLFQMAPSEWPAETFPPWNCAGW